MSLELVAIVITGVISLLDLTVNMWTACMAGRVKCSCFNNCFRFEHEEQPENSHNTHLTDSTVERLAQRISTKETEKSGDKNESQT